MLRKSTESVGYLQKGHRFLETPADVASELARQGGIWRLQQDSQQILLKGVLAGHVS